MRSRLGSFLAVFPLAVWTVNHLWNNLAAFRGASEWEAAVTQYPHPVAQLATAIVVLLPLVLHTVWGVGRLLTSRPNNVKYTYYGNLKYMLQRLTAIGVLLFLGAHLWLAMLQPRFVQGGPEPFSDISHEMHFHTPTLIVYLLGTLGVAYHLANGLGSFAMGWGVVTSQRALNKLDWIVIPLFLIFLAMAWGAIYALYRAGAA
ncbi:MAG: succinate dehydrogenase [Polyangiaceae bacterium]